MTISNCRAHLRVVHSKSSGIRELTQVEYQHLWPNIHRSPAKFAKFLTAYNLAKAGKNHIDFVIGRRGRFDFVIVYRETLPDYFQDMLNIYESTRDTPFVGGYFKQNR